MERAVGYGVGVAAPGAEAVIVGVRNDTGREDVAATVVEKECGNGGTR